MKTLRLPDYLALGLIAGMITMPLLPDHFTLVLFGQSLPAGIFLLVLLAAMCVLLYRRLSPVLLMIASVGMIVTGTVGVRALVAAEAPHVNDRLNDRHGALVVATWNTEYWDQGDDQAAFVEAIRRIDADVLLLQEHIFWDNSSHSLVDISRTAMLETCCGYRHVWVSGELVIASRLDGQMIDSGNENLLRATIRHDGQSLDVINVHLPVHVTLLESPFDAAFWRYTKRAIGRREATLDVLQHTLDTVSHPIVGGDFNATALMPGFRRQVLARLDTRASDLYPPTFPASGPALWRLDYLLSGASFARECEVLNEAHLSDHHAVRCQLRQAGAA